MKIECKLKRDGGSKIDLDNTEYHFAPVDYGNAHVAEVEDDEHIARFLAIPEGYRIYKDQSATKTVAEQDDEDGPQPAGQSANSQEDGNERADLAAQYEAKFGKKPHYKLSAEKIRAELDAE